MPAILGLNYILHMKWNSSVTCRVRDLFSYCGCCIKRYSSQKKPVRLDFHPFKKHVWHLHECDYGFLISYNLKKNIELWNDWVTTNNLTENISCCCNYKNAANCHVNQPLHQVVMVTTKCLCLYYHTKRLPFLIMKTISYHLNLFLLP